MERLVSTLRPGETDALVERIARREIDPFTAAEELTSRAGGLGGCSAYPQNRKARA